MEKGESVPSFKARFKKVGKFTSGTNEHGAWSFQNCVVTDGNGEIKVKLHNRPELSPKYEGREVYFSSAVGTKKPFVGITRDIDEYRGRTGPMLVVDDRAVMEEADPAAASRLPAGEESVPRGTSAPPPARETAPESAQEPPDVQEPSYQPPANASLQTEDERKECIRKARAKAGKAANALILCFDAAFYVARVVEAKYGVKFEPESVKAMAVHFSIGMERADLIDGLPSGVMPQQQGQKTGANVAGAGQQTNQ